MHINNRLAVLLFTVITSFSCFAQDSLKQTDNGESISKWNVKVGLTNYIYWYFPSYLVGVEYFPTDHLSFYLEGGRNLPHLSDDIGEVTKGDEVGVETRIYLGRRNVDAGFVGVRFQYRNISLNDRYTIGFQCDPVKFKDCVYYMELDGDLVAQFYGLQLIGGGQFSISDRVGLDLYAGVGRLSRVLDKNSTNNGILVESSGILDEEYFSIVPHMSIKAALIYRL